MRKFTEAQRQVALDMLAARNSYLEIQLMTGISRATISVLAHGEGLLRVHRNYREHPKKQRSLALVRAGATHVDVAKFLKVSHTLVWRWARAAGFECKSQIRDHATIEAAVLAVASGARPRDVAKTHGVVVDTIKSWCRAVNIDAASIPAAMRRKIVSAVRSGKSYALVSRDFDVSSRAVTRICEDAGVASNSNPNTHKAALVISAETKAQIQALRDQGLRPREIALRLGVSSRTAERYSRKKAK